jgi:hypothetical protein
MIPIRNKQTDISSDVAEGRKLHEKIKKLADEVAKKSIDGNIDLDKVIAEVSKREKFNQLQIQRLVEEGNTVTYNKRYEKVKHSNDRRLSYPIASLEGVLAEMGADAPEEIKNPNFATGKQGSGDMKKVASSIESLPIHNPNGRLSEREEKYKKKLAAMKERRTEQEKVASEREHKSDLFKIANSLVMSERQYKNGNEIFNTMLSDVNIPQEDVDGIKKIARDISEQLVRTRRSHNGFMVTLEENPTEKVANHLLGEYSLLKVAEDTGKVKEIKIQPTTAITDFQQLISLARKLEKESVINQPAQAGGEVK